VLSLVSCDSVTETELLAVGQISHGPAKHDIYASPLLHCDLAQLRRIYVAGYGKDRVQDDGRLFNAELKKQE
jgi:hypothetical protein